MAEAVYALCAVASIACALLLLRQPRENRRGLVFWTGACFVGLAINNILLFVDLVVVPSIDLTLLRDLVALVAMMVLLFGLVWDRP